jgi:hypothetical protein
MIYYIFTSKKHKQKLTTENIHDAFDFVKKYNDAKVWTMEWNTKPKIMDRRNFLKKYYELTQDKNKMFQMAEIMVKGEMNFNTFLRKAQLIRSYEKYKGLTEKFL